MSPIGELHFSIFLRVGCKRGIYVSVPYRGATFLNDVDCPIRICDIALPSPIGELHFSMKQLISLTSMRYSFPSPIGELHFSISFFSVSVAFSSVSVPYRGATFLNHRRENSHTKIRKFPSPIGELHFSIIFVMILVYCMSKFPSPIGELHFSIFCKTAVASFRYPWFPSPIGELHFSIAEESMETRMA